MEAKRLNLFILLVINCLLCCCITQLNCTDINLSEPLKEFPAVFEPDEIPEDYQSNSDEGNSSEIPPVFPTSLEEEEPVIIDGEYIYQHVFNSEKFQMDEYDYPIVFKSSKSSQATSGQFTIIPPKGFGLISVVQSLNMRLENCTGYDKSNCHTCLDYVEVSTSNKTTNKTCGYLRWNGGSTGFRGERSFISAINQELTIKIYQANFTENIYDFPSFELVVTAYNNCSNKFSDRLKECPNSYGDFAKEGPYCISREVFCDESINCPVTGSNFLNSMTGIETDESKCYLANDGSPDRYDVKILTRDEILHDSSPVVYHDGSDESEEGNMIPDTITGQSSKNSENTSMTNFLQLQRRYYALWVTVIFLVVLLVGVCTRSWYKSASKKALRRKKRRALPIYHKLETFNLKKEEPIAVVSTHKKLTGQFKSIDKGVPYERMY